MSTLKICTHDHTYHLCGVRQVMELRTFTLPEGEEDPMSNAFPVGVPTPSYVTVVDFKGQANKDGSRTGKVIRISRLPHDGDAETWVVPEGSCFLLSDVGKTVDRI